MDEGPDESHHQPRLHWYALCPLFHDVCLHLPYTSLDLVVSSCNIPTIPLTVAQAMNPAPRPPSPTARAATQRAMRPENPNQLTQRDAQVLLMGVPAKDKGVNAQHAERTRLESFFTNDTLSTNGTEPASKKPVSPKTTVPPRPSRELRRLSSQPESVGVRSTN